MLEITAVKPVNKTTAMATDNAEINTSEHWQDNQLFFHST